MTRKKRARRLRKNPLSTKQKLLVVGGLAVVGGVAAYALAGSQSTPSTPPAPTGADLANQCALLQQQLRTMKAASSPDQPSIQRLETQVAQCIQQARAAGGEVDNVTANISDGDQAYQQIENWFNEYKGTEYADALKRNNIRKNMLDTGQAMAAKYAAAANAATNDADANSVRQSILRALDSAVQRRICYQYDAPGCGRFGVNEDHGNDKAAQEQTRVIQPLMDAHGLAVQKLSATRPSDNEVYARITLAPAAAASDHADSKFSEYKATEYSDALRRNNLRQEVLGSGVESVNDLNAILPDLTDNIYATLGGLQKAEAVLLTALGRSYARWICYLTAASGCDRFGVNEDASSDKAGQEWAQVVVPLQNLYVPVASKLARFGDDGYKPYIALRLQIAQVLGNYVNAKFAEYKSVDYADPIRRNNLRGVFTVAAAQLAGFLAGTMSLAIDAANQPGPISMPALVASTPTMMKAVQALQPALRTSLTLPASTATHGLGLATAAPAVAKRIDGGGLIRQVITAINTALSAAGARWDCFEVKAPGCDQSGTSEASNFDKAAWEQANVINPLFAALTAGYGWLSAHGDANADRDLTAAKLARCTSMHQLAVAKWAEYDSVTADPIRKANVDAHARQIEQDCLACMRALNPTSAAGAALVANAIQSWKSENRSYPAGMDDLLTRWKSAAGMSGLGEVDNGVLVPLVLAVAVGGVLVAMSRGGKQSRPTRNTRRRRTSRRAR